MENIYTASEENNYSSPVPVIGLYIAAASLVCFFLLLSDVIYGFRSRKNWLPCRSFILNSVTLSLLSVVGKIPVDLTTAMPSAIDQFSKLTGTAAIGVCMVVLWPSVGVVSASESVSNVWALTILVITVVVNICIQMSTGAIFSFIVEHVIVMFCMLHMLLYYWLTIWSDYRRRSSHEIVAGNCLRKGEEDMLSRLKVCFMHSYGFNPQYVFSSFGHSVFATSSCSTCFVVVLEGGLRSIISHEHEHEHVFSNGKSDYGWSMNFIVVTQVLVILLASLVCCYRFFAIPEDLLHSDPAGPVVDGPSLTMAGNFPNLKGGSVDAIVQCFVSSAWFVQLVVLYIPVIILTFIKMCVPYGRFERGDTDTKVIEEHKNLLHATGIELNERTLIRCVKDFQRWIKMSQEKNSSSHLRAILSKRPPSEPSLEQLNRHLGFHEGEEISCLYVVFLVRIASVPTLPTRSVDLTRSLNDVFNIIHFVDTEMYSLSTEHKIRCKLGKAMWRGNDFGNLFRKIERNTTNESLPTVDRALPAVDRALSIINKLKTVLFKSRDDSKIWEKLDFVTNSINSRGCSTVEELNDYMEQLFVDMLHIFLCQLPCAIIKHVNESTYEEYDEKIRFVVKLLYQVQSLDGLVNWSFPDGFGINKLKASSTGDQAVV